MSRSRGAAAEEGGCQHQVEDVKSRDGMRIHGRRCVLCGHQWALVKCRTCGAEKMFEARGRGPYYCRGHRPD